MNYPVFPLSKGLTILWSILQTVLHRAIFESSFIALFPNSYSFPCIRDCQGARTDGREKGLCMNDLLPFPMPGAAHWASRPRKGHRGHARGHHRWLCQAVQEVLRTGDPLVYSGLPGLKSLFTGNGETGSGKRHEPEKSLKAARLSKSQHLTALGSADARLFPLSSRPHIFPHVLILSTLNSDITHVLLHEVDRNLHLPPSWREAPNVLTYNSNSTFTY